MRADDRVGLLERQREVVTDLVAQLRRRGPGELQPAFREDLAEATSDAERLRVIVDQVASLTDASAVAWQARLQRG
jgi:dGTPase